MQRYTLTFSEAAGGWPSFYSYFPDWMIGMNNYFYTFHLGNLYRHNVNEQRNMFYGIIYPSTIKSVLNTSPLENKIFKTLNIEGDHAWAATLATDLQASGYIYEEWFQKKEQSWFAFVRNADVQDYALRSVNGIGRTKNISGTDNNLVLTFEIGNNPTVIGSIISIGDLVYYIVPPNQSPIFCGVVKRIDVNYPIDLNKLLVDASVPGGSVPPTTTPYIMYVKNSVAESHGVLGHYCVFELNTTVTSKIELFAVESEVMKSYP